MQENLGEDQRCVVCVACEAPSVRGKLPRAFNWHPMHTSPGVGREFVHWDAAMDKTHTFCLRMLPTLPAHLVLEVYV